VSIFRQRARRITERLGVYDHVALARRKRTPGLSRNERDDRHLVAILAAVLRPDSATVDVGAHVGGVLREIVRLAPDGRHMAFEPIPSLAERLAHDYPGVEVHAAAAADRSGTATFQWIESEPAMSGLQLPAKHAALGPTAIEVRLERLDDVVDESPAFLKIDVEGGEEAVLRGAQDTLERYRPLVALEHGLAAAAFGTLADGIYELLTSPGLRVFDMDGRGPFSRDQFVEVVGIGEHFNFIAH
jgi:FkbM family methyltransferase